MADQVTAPEGHVYHAQPGATETRRPFAAPRVEDLGRLQALTQFQISVPLPP